MGTEIKYDINQLVKDLENIGVKKGDVLAVGASFKRMGEVVGGPDTVIDALINAVGTEGTIMFNSYTRKFQLSEIKNSYDYIFDYRVTPSLNGILSETLRKKKGALRSTHPVNSVVAIGRYAEFLTISHTPYSHSYLPYSKLAEINGKMICIGIGDNIVGLRHEAQYLAGLLSIVPYNIGTWYMDVDGNRKLFVKKDASGCVTKLPALVEPLRQQGVVVDGSVGDAKSVLVLDVKKALEQMTYMLKNNPEIFLCNDFTCLWCRELERRMNLYNKIKNPVLFQKNILLRYFLFVLNVFRLKNNKIAIKFVTNVLKRIKVAK